MVSWFDRWKTDLDPAATNFWALQMCVSADNTFDYTVRFRKHITLEMAQQYADAYSLPKPRRKRATNTRKPKKED